MSKLGQNYRLTRLWLREKRVRVIICQT